MAEVRLGAGDLERLVAAIFTAEGLPPDGAGSVARGLVLADLRGQTTHGTSRVPAYLKRIEAGLINRTPHVTIDSRRPFAASLDGDNAMGFVVADAAMAAATARARATGIGVVTARRSNHFGAASVHTAPVARQGLIAIAMAPGAKSLAPHGSREPLLGTNPIAVSVPSGPYHPWTLDMAASVAARGHIRLAQARGEPIPEGWALDEDGAPTTDPARALRGVMLPFAGAKGSAIAMMVDILAGVLSGSAFAGDVRDWNADYSAPADVGHFFLVMDVEAFMPLAAFEARMATAIRRLKALDPAAGFDEVLYPGERAGRSEAQRREEGIPLEAGTREGLAQAARTRGVPLPPEFSA